MSIASVPAAWCAAVDSVAEELLAETGLDHPPVDALALARRLKVAVAFDDAQQSRGRHKRIDGRSSIFLKPDPRPERMQWAAAHELGEVVAWQIFERAGADEEPSPETREQTANLLASRLLLPSLWFRDDARRLDGDVLALKQRYCTASHELIAWRLLDLPDPAIVTIFDLGRLTRRRSNATERPPRLQPIERECQAEVSRQGRPAELHAGGLRVQGWPVHEEGWTREILRTTARGAEPDCDDCQDPDNGDCMEW